AAAGPANAALDQLLKPFVAPGSLIMAPRRIENAALAVRPHPRPRLFAFLVLAVFKDSAILLIVLGVRVGLIAAFEAAVALHDRMIGRGDRRAECHWAVSQELRADEFNVLRRIEEAV